MDTTILESVSTKEQLAELLDGREYGAEMLRLEERIAEENGLVVVFGRSDDLIELLGAIDEELDAYQGGKVYLIRSNSGHWVAIAGNDNILKTLPESIHPPIIAEWMPEKYPDCSWLIASEIPHATFKIMEGESVFCVGIVFSLADLVA